MNKGNLALSALALTLAVTAAGWTASRPAAAANQPFPAPPAEAVAPRGTQVAVLAGGCFWGVQGVFEHVKGVRQVTAGYAGGTRATATYSQVSSETTSHAEAVRISYDPAVVSYGQLLQIYFAVAHDPTQVNGQYPDEGKSYRSAIFAQSPQQQQTAAAYITALNRTRTFTKPIATRLETGSFYAAETYHQQFMRRNPNHPYILAWDVARVQRLKARFPGVYVG